MIKPVNFQGNVVDSSGSVIPNAQVTVTNKSTGFLPILYSDLNDTPLVNPFNADANGAFKFYTESQVCKIKALDGGFVREWEDEFLNDTDGNYPTLQDAISAPIDAGQIITTTGYHTVNDGGAGQYIVVPQNTGTDDGGSYLDMVNGNQLELIIDDDINIRQFGAYGDGVTNDTLSTYNAITASKKHSLFFPNGTYLVDQLNFNVSNGDSVILIGESRTGARIDFTTNGLSISITPLGDYRESPSEVNISNLTFLTKNTNLDYGLKLEGVPAGTNIGADYNIDSCGFVSEDGGSFVESIYIIGLSKGLIDDIRMQGDGGANPTMNGIRIQEGANLQVPVDNIITRIRMQNMATCINLIDHVEGTLMSELLLVGCTNGVNISSPATRTLFFTLENSHINCTGFAINLSGVTRGYIESNVLIFVNSKGLVLDRTDGGYCRAAFVNQGASTLNAIESSDLALQDYIIGGAFYNFDINVNLSVNAGRNVVFDPSVRSVGHVSMSSTGLEIQIPNAFNILDGGLSVGTGAADSVTIRSITSNLDRITASKNILQTSVGGVNVSRLEVDSLSSETEQDLGSTSLRWDTLYAINGTINTSDEREKTQLLQIEGNELLCSQEIKKSMRKFKFSDAVADKGENARIHWGVGAQTIKSIFESNNLNPDHYAMFCYDEWEDEWEDSLGDNGERVKKQTIVAGNRYGIRYEELLCFVIAGM